jgi:hypothetical protein
MTRFLWPGRGAFLGYVVALAALILLAVRLTGLAAFQRCGPESCATEWGRLLGFYVLAAVIFYLIFCWIVWGWRRVIEKHSEIVAPAPSSK